MHDWMVDWVCDSLAALFVSYVPDWVVDWVTDSVIALFAVDVTDLSQSTTN